MQQSHCRLKFSFIFNHEIETILQQNKQKRGGQALTANDQAQELESKMNGKHTLFWEVHQNTKPLLRSTALHYVSQTQRNFNIHYLHGQFLLHRDQVHRLS